MSDFTVSLTPEKINLRIYILVGVKIIPVAIIYHLLSFRVYS